MGYSFTNLGCTFERNLVKGLDRNKSFTERVQALRLMQTVNMKALKDGFLMDGLNRSRWFFTHEPLGHGSQQLLGVLKIPRPNQARACFGPSEGLIGIGLVRDQSPTLGCLKCAFAAPMVVLKTQVLLRERTLDWRRWFVFGGAGFCGVQV